MNNKATLKFVNFTKLDDDALVEILEKRNLPNIREKMANSQVISKEEHLKFCHSLKTDKSKLYFKVLYNDEFVGVMDFQNIDYEKHSYEPGSYFFNEENTELAVHCSSAICYICLELGLYYPNIYVKKTNFQALMFNTMKLANSIIGEDEEYYYLTNSFVDVTKRSLDEINADLVWLESLYNLEFDV